MTTDDSNGSAGVSARDATAKIYADPSRGETACDLCGMLIKHDHMEYELDAAGITDRPPAPQKVP